MSETIRLEHLGMTDPKEQTTMTDHTTFVDDVDVDEAESDETVDSVVNEDAATEPPTDDEPAHGELVEREQEQSHVTAIERAAQAAIDNPGIPGRDEFLSLAAQARILSLSAAAPESVQNDPHLAFHVAMIGRDLGISPSAALELIDVIPGSRNKPPQLSLSPQLLNGQIRRLGLGSIVPAVKTNERCVAVVLGPNGRLDPRCKRTWPDHWTDEHDPTARCECRDQIGDYEFTWQDAQMAGLAGADCQPGQHTKDCQNWVRGKSCNSGYKSYPKRMMWWRASGFAADDYFPEAGLGLYTAEELGAVVDADGRPVDPADAELPPGYGPKAIDAPKENAPAPQETIDAFKARIERIKGNEQAAAALRNIWTATMDDGSPRLPPLPRLRAGDVHTAEAAIKSVEQQLDKGKFGEQPQTDDADAGETDDETPAEDGSSDEQPADEDDGHSHTGDPIVDEIVDAVKAMPIADVIDELGHRGLTVRGNEQTKRQRLAQSRYEERIGGQTSPGSTESTEQGADTGETAEGHTEAEAESAEQGSLDD